MRENTKIILWVVVIAFVITIFAVWGLDLQSGSMNREQTMVGRVNGVPITPQAYQAIYAQLSQQFRATSPGADLSALQQELLREQAWENIVSNIITSEQIEKLGIGVTDEEVLTFLRTSPPPEIQQYFVDANGRFDIAAYQAALNNPEADWTAVEELVRQRIPVVKLNQYLMAQVHVSAEEIRTAFDEEAVVLKARYVSFPIDAEDLGGWEPGEDDVNTYYQAHPEQFEVPEMAVVETVRIPLAPAPRDRDDLLYTARTVRGQALDDGADFGDLAKTYSESHTAAVGGETGLIGETQRDPAVIAAAAALAPGQISEPIETPNAVVLVQLIETRREKNETKYNLREIVMNLEPGSTTVDSLNTIALEIRDRAAADGDLAAAAATHGLTVTTSEPFGAGMPIPGVGFVPAIARFAFAAEPGAVSSIIADDAGLYVSRLVSRSPASLRPVADVAPAIRETLVRERRLELATRKANAFRRSAGVPSVPFEQAAAQYGYALASTDSFTVSQSVAGLPPFSSFARAALAIQPGTVSSAVASGDAVYVVRVDARRDPMPSEFQARAPQIRERIFREKIQTYVSYWYESLKAQSKIEDFREAS